MVSDEQATDRKVPTRSKYLFPAYDLGTSLRITERVERDGGGELTEATLAVNMGVSAKSSGFRLRTLSARQFGLMVKQGDKLSTTSLAKAIFKPRTNEERQQALRDTFLKMPLFAVVAARYHGEPLPPSERFRNVLERKFEIDFARVSAAERVLLDSARESGVLVASGGQQYLSTDGATALNTTAIEPSPSGTGPVVPLPPDQPPVVTAAAPTPTGSLIISEQDVAELSDSDFATVWDALGKVFRARGKRQMNQQRRAEQAIDPIEEATNGQAE